MNRLLLLLAATAISAACGCSATQGTDKTVTVKSHPVIITGRVLTVSRTNIDKSGKNPRFMLHFTVIIEQYDDGGWNVILGPEIKAVCRESDLIKQTGRKIQINDRVRITSHILEKTPEIIAAVKVELPDREE